MEEEFKCKLCKNVTFGSYTSLSRHMSRTHNIKCDQFYVEYYLSGNWPVCKCGCGEKVNYSYALKSFREFNQGHQSRIKNNWGNNPKALEHSINTRRKRFASGEITTWNNGLTTETDSRVKAYGEKISENKERAEKISVSLTGLSKSEEHIQKITKNHKKYWADPVHREEQSHRRMLYIKEHGFEVKSKLEDKFAKFMDELKMHYHRQHYVREIKGLFDFYLNDKCFVEIQGDFWHCKPGTKYEIPKYESQKNNLEMDKIKEEWCKKNGILLLKFWESDINSNPSEVVKQLLNEVSQ